MPAHRLFQARDDIQEDGLAAMSGAEQHKEFVVIHIQRDIDYGVAHRILDDITLSNVFKP